MATMKTVYFCDSDPKVWFENYKDAERFDKVAEVADYAHSKLSTSLHKLDVICVVERIAERYTLDQRYDWAEPEKEDQDETATI